MVRTFKDMIARDALILGVFICLLAVLMILSGCSTKESGQCTIAADCDGLVQDGSCSGEWECLQGQCAFSCAAQEQEITGDNETDEIGSQLEKIEDSLNELDMAYIDQLEKDISSLTW